MGRRENERIYQSGDVMGLCQCVYCGNDGCDVATAYSMLSASLAELGVDIEKPFETMSLEVHARGMIAYSGVQYIVGGATE